MIHTVTFPERRVYVNKCDASEKKLIQETIDICAGQGGGYVIVPAGKWLTSPLHLKSNICLVLEEGAEVWFSDCPEDYLPVVFTRWEGFECYNYSPLIYGLECENIGIIGKGVFYGNGESWWHWKKLQQRAADELNHVQANGIPVEQRVYGTREAALRPSFFQPVRCRNVLLEGVRFVDGPQWTLHPVYCNNVTIRNVEVDSHGPNTDGLNPDSCCDVLIEGCSFDTGDDCIAINSGMNEDGWRVGIPCTNIEIKKCRMRGGHGALTIGSAVSGGVENVYIHDCEVSGSMQGIRLKSMRGRGGYVRNVKFENITINDVSNEAIQINMFYEFSTCEPTTQIPSDFADIVIENVQGRNAQTGIMVNGMPEHPMESLTIRNVKLTAQNAMECRNVKNLVLENVEIGSSM